jgi:hypothetical protein
LGEHPPPNLTTQPLLTTPHCQMMNFNSTLHHMLRMWRMHSYGSMSAMQSVNNYHPWLIITSLFPSTSLIFSHLSWMQKPLSIATTVNIEHVFSHGCIVLPYVHNHLTVQFMHISLCIILWSFQGLVKDADIRY